MVNPFLYTRWWIGIFCGLIFMLETIVPIEYVFGYLYVIPIMLAAYQSRERYDSSEFAVSSLTASVTKICIFLALIDFAIVESTNYHFAISVELQVSSIVNRINAMVTLLLTAWLIQLCLKYKTKIHLQQQQIDRYQAELFAQKELDALHEYFVYTLTHDLRTPMFGAIQTIELFQQEKFGAVTSNQSNVLKTMSRSQQLSLQLVETVLDVYRNNTEGLTLQIQSIDLCEIARDAIDVMAILGLERQIEFNLNYYDPSMPLSQLFGDPLQLNRVFSNLLSNALYHSPKGGQIDIIVNYSDFHYLVEVLDRGKGISPGELPFLFDRFYQSQSQLKGSGLGLYLSRQIIEAHGGEIWAESTPPHGAKFCFSLPI